ncbi:MAG: hypothetical protein HFG50_11100 [Lachnospiraceae bacterium]|nr:hypothetical protein [Lachnospiraceae bacterium]
MSDKDYKKLYDAKEDLSRCLQNLDKAIEEHHEKHKKFDKEKASIEERIRYNQEYTIKEARISKDIENARERLLQIEMELGLRSKN